jgi:hypothetical protein
MTATAQVAIGKVAQVVIDEQNPWPGLGSFDESAQRFFNGRRNESAELRRLVLQAPLTVLFGASGLGKTSLVQAGLFPLVRKEYFLPVYVRLDVRERTAPLIDQLKVALKSQIQALGIDAPLPNSDESLWQYLHRRGLEMWSARNQLLTPVFVLDQFEEVFTLGAVNPAGVARLRLDLGDLIENRVPGTVAERLREKEAEGEPLSLDSQRYKVLLSFREDFLPTIEEWKRDLPSILRNRLRLLPMSRAQAFEAVHATAPALVDERLAGQIVDFVAAAEQEGTTSTPDVLGGSTGPAVEPALLSLVCHGLNKKRKAQGKARFDQELLEGGKQSIISDYYENAVGDMPDEVQTFIENELITERGFRKPCDVDDARSVHRVTDEQLRLLVDRRLLRIEPQRGTDRVELTHDLLTGVVHEHRDQRRRVEAREVEKSRRREVRRARAYAFVLGVAFLIACGFGAWAVQEGRKAENAAQLARNAEQGAHASLREANEQRTRAESAEQVAVTKADEAQDAESKEKEQAERAGSAESRARREARRAGEQEEAARLEVLGLRKATLYDASIMVDLYAQRIEASETDAEAVIWHNLKAEALSQMGAHLESIGEYELTLKTASDNPRANLARGYEYLTLFAAEKSDADTASYAQSPSYVQDAKESMKDTASYLKDDPNNWIAHQNMALAQARLREYADAKKSIRKSIDSFAHSSGSVGEYQISPDIEGATGRKVLSYSEESARVALYYEMAGLTACEGGAFRGEFNNANKEAGKLLDRHQRLAAYLVALNWAWMRERKEDYGGFAAQGALWERAQYPDRAQICYRRFQKRYNENADARYKKLSLWVNQRVSGHGSVGPPKKRLDAGALALGAQEKLYIVLAGADPDGSQIPLDSGKERLLDLAKTDVSKAIKLEPRNVDFLWQRIDILFEMKRYEEMIKDCDSILKRDPHSALAHYWKAVANRAEGKASDEIISDLDEALHYDPNNAETLLFKGRYVSDPKESIELFKKALRTNTDPAMVRQISDELALRECESYHQSLDFLVGDGRDHSEAVGVLVRKISSSKEALQVDRGAIAAWWAEQLKGDPKLRRYEKIIGNEIERLKERP